MSIPLKNPKSPHALRKTSLSPMSTSKLSQGVLMADGNLRVETTRTVMLVHRSVLALHSLFFRHLFVLHTPRCDQTSFLTTHRITIDDEDLVRYIESLYSTRQYVIPAACHRRAFNPDEIGACDFPSGSTCSPLPLSFVRVSVIRMLSSELISCGVFDGISL